MQAIYMHHNEFHSKWNYVIKLNFKALVATFVYFRRLRQLEAFIHPWLIFIGLQ